MLGACHFRGGLRGLLLLCGCWQLTGKYTVPFNPFSFFAAPAPHKHLYLSLAPPPPAAQDLKARYQPITAAACRRHWEAAYEAAGVEQPGGRQAPRKKRVHILGGAVMRCWGAVQVCAWGGWGPWAGQPKAVFPGLAVDKVCKWSALASQLPAPPAPCPTPAGCPPARAGGAGAAPEELGAARARAAHRDHG